MATAVLMPELGESVDEATISQWLKKVGEEIAEFEPIVEVHTDKVDTEIPSPATGVILKILAAPNEVVQAGKTLAWIGSPDEQIPDGDEPLASAVVAEIEVVESESFVEAGRARTSPSVRPGQDADLGFISPVVARMAAEHQLNLHEITGSGKNGRITKMDVLAHLEKQTETEAQPSPTAAAHPRQQMQPQPGEVVKLTRMRALIADHMAMSKATSPHVTTVMEADMSRVVAHRAEYKPVFARDQVKLTYTAYFIAAIAAALKANPYVNSSWSDGGVVLHRAINIGMATALETDGLIVPVIKSADQLSLLGIAGAVNDLAHRAREGHLMPDEVQGGTFTITNHGTSGSLFATPIINQPQCGILGVGLMEKRVVVINDAIAIRPMVYISLTFDHRILDGAAADQFLGGVKNRLETWS